MYPVMLNLNGKSILIVGGGRIAKRKLSKLIGEGAHITVIAPEIDAWILNQDVHCIKRQFDLEDLSAFDMVFITTNDQAVNDVVYSKTSPQQLVNDCTNQTRSSFFNMASFIYDGMKIMISTEGQDASKSKQFKAHLLQLLSKG
ncbi:bifunctional precorrin-2 dehydrogenase/sirohydrochlorin ferrochelatase [Macrococcus sp. DPC7161]|uniref:precorrin-2 dehydrogenase/sirohydrochlorin ferrochelatase family protein n=1 Tax=Macrococcus sp. DPC7161 TaxID=2507060 RepID=UPI00100BAADF|nr:bifunctional precorrin-2 dehydrogenase/sirohydrochlorin ferrochelatase [Macrococcus sp. DPC7161]RXK18205.1 bifunctional precorrin-2 dehydrogenase/sirohydrochlorin ferrochelatase [Macrococcus sp. DPC7161]